MLLKDAKFSRHLSRLSKKEIKSFYLFLESPYLNSKKELSELLKILVKFHPRFDHKNYSLTFIKGQLQKSDISVSLSKLNKMIHDLYQCMLKFHAVQSIVQSKVNWLPKALKAIQGNPQFNDHPHLTNDYLKSIEQQHYRKSNDYLELAHNYKYMYDLSINQDNIGNTSYLKNYNENLDKYYLLEKLEFRCAKLARSNVLLDYSSTAEIQHTPSLNMTVDPLKEPIFELYSNLILLYANHSTELFYKIKNSFTANFKLISPSQSDLVLSKLINFIFLKVKQGHDDFSQESFLILKFAVENSIISTFTPSRFLNIVVSACISSETNFARTFIDENRNKITGSDYQDTISLSNAFVFFHCNSYDKSYEQLLLINSKKVHFQIRVKTLILRCLYEFYLQEAKYEKTLRSKIVAFERYLTRDLIISEVSNIAYLNFAKTLKSLISKTAQTDITSFKIQALRQLNNSEHIIAKKWFEIKINEM